MDAIRVPNEIDSPHQFLLWSVDEFVPFITLFIIGNFVRQLFLFSVLGAILGHLYKRYKNTRPDGYLNHLLYWVGLKGDKGITIVNPYIREFYP